MKTFLLFLTALLLAAANSSAETRVSLLTALPGSEIYELEGHTGLRVQDSGSGTDMVVNWGIFDFNSPNFVYRFVKGETDYLCAAEPTQWFMDNYHRQGRQVIEQTLSLNSVQTATLIGLLRENLRPENRVYRYNYVKDNCATRPLQMIEQAIGRQLVSGEPAMTSFRHEMELYHSAYPWYQFGIDLALGRGIDAPISRREAAFAPVKLMDELRQSGVVASECAHGNQEVKPEPTPWPLRPLTVSLAVMIIALVLTLLPYNIYARAFDSLMFTLFGLTGCVLFFLVAVSTHEATSPNLLLLWLNPLCLLGAIFPWIKSTKKAANCYFFANFALILLLAILAPMLGRTMNAAFWPLMAADLLRSAANINRLCRNKNRT